MTPNRTDFLDAATSIGRRLCRDAIWCEGRCNWLGWGMEPHGGQWIPVHRAMSSFIYDGTAGISIFLARLWHLTGDPIIRATAEGALAQAVHTIDAIRVTGEYGYYSGLSGIAWACIDAGRALDNDDLVTRGRDAMDQVARLAPHPHRLDIINGSAGLICVLLAASGGERRAELLDAAVRHGEHLLRAATKTDRGWSWDTLGMPGERHLLGLAHGVAGIAYALVALAESTGLREYRAAADEALRYERSYFSATEGNWPDLRSFAQPGPSGEPPCMLAWCHGAPGIGMARLALHQLAFDASSVLDEAETAIRTTSATLGQASSGMGNFSLCHGDGGNADLLLFGADVLARPTLRAQAEAVGMRALDRYERAGMPWPCGVMNAGETPNLLLGLAGIGYSFLRLHNSADIPTVLLPAGGPRYAQRPPQA